MRTYGSTGFTRASRAPFYALLLTVSSKPFPGVSLVRVASREETMNNTKNCQQCEVDYDPDDSLAQSEERFCSIECQEAYEEAELEEK